MSTVLDLYTAASGLRDLLAAAGVPAALSMADLNPPAVLVQAPDIAYKFGGKFRADLDFTILAVAPNTGTEPALIVLSDLLDRIHTALGGRILDAEPVDVAGLDGTAPMPGYRITLPTNIIIPTEVTP